MTGSGGETLSDLNDPDVKDRRVSARYAYIVKCFENYKSASEKKYISAPFNISKNVLMGAVESYYNDIQRLKNFHQMETADRFKVAGYTMRWLMQTCPVHLEEKRKEEDIVFLGKKEDSRLLTVNADFAFTVGSNMAGADPVKAEPKMVNAVIYTLHYRDIEPGMTALFMELFARVWPKTAPTEKRWSKNPISHRPS